MTETIWRKLWLLVLLANDIPTPEAQQALDVLYGNQEIDLNKDPISDALMLLPQRCANAERNDGVWKNFASARSDGLLQQSWSAGVDHLGKDAVAAQV